MMLEIFAGSGQLSLAMRRLGYAAVAIDVDNGDWQDVLRPGVRDVLRGWCSSHAAAAVWIGMPCSSWSVARRGPPSSTWCALRSREHVEGLPGLRDVDQQKVILGNRLRDFTAWLVRLCVDMSIPVFVENPVSSRVWSSRPLEQLRRLPSFEETVFDMCAFGAEYRKRTKVWSWGSPSLQALGMQCRGKKSCSFSGKPHTVLTGQHPSLGVLWTHAAQPYPPALCDKLALCISKSWEDRRQQRLTDVCCGLRP